MLKISQLLLLTFAVSIVGIAQAADEWLTVTVNGVSKKLDKNIRAHLGELPKNDIQRRAFLFSVEDNTQDALQSMGYYDGVTHIQVLENDKGPWELKLDITLGNPIILEWIDIFFDGEMLEDEAFRRWLDGLKIKPGDRLDHGAYEEVKSQLLTLALARGYFEGTYTLSEISINRDNHTARINLHFSSGRRYRFGEVTFEGHSLNEDVLDSLVPFDNETPYSTSDIGELNRNLLETGYFANIKVLPQIDEIQDGEVPISVDVSDRPSHSFEFGFGVDIGGSSDSNVEPRVRATWRTPQVNRYGHKQETTAEWSPDRPKLLTTYTIPLSDPLDDQLKIRLGLLRDKYGVTQDYSPDDRQYNNTGQLESEKYLVGVVRQIRTPSNWIWGYSMEGINERYNQQDTDYDPYFVIFGIGASKTVRGDNSLDPKSGYRHTYSLEYADPSLGSQVRLTRFQAKYKWIETLWDKHRFVSRLDFGVNLVDEEDIAFIPPSLRFFSGGDQSIRGYRYQELGPYIEYVNDQGGISREVVGGRYLLVGSLEYQYYLTPSWRLATFVDAGNAFDTDQFEPVIAVGGGIHWITPIGPIKLDVGFGLKETETVDRSFRFHLTMGTEL